MNTIRFGAAAPRHFGEISDEPKSDRPKSDGAKSDGAKSDRLMSDNPSDTAWAALEAANDLGDDATIEACRRVIDANLSGAAASPSDLHIVLDYFR
jgi:cobalamin biosynthesis protein CobT